RFLLLILLLLTKTSLSKGRESSEEIVFVIIEKAGERISSSEEISENILSSLESEIMMESARSSPSKVRTTG
ncbi:MAG: hypothetical protein ACKO96_27335, partial [Flammeovirgaceae bacterium]